MHSVFENNNSGFTALELIVVLVMISIVSIAILTRLYDRENDAIAQSEAFKTYLRYAQAKAMNSNIIWGIHSDGSSYWLFKNGNTGIKVAFPGENSDTITVSGRSIDSMESFTLSFDDRGTPFTDAAATSGQELESADPESEISVTAGEFTKTVTITPNTGFVP